MEIIPIFSQAPSGIPEVLHVVVALCCATAVMHFARRLWANRHLPSIHLPGALSLGTLPLVLSHGALGTASDRHPQQDPIREIETSPALDERVPLSPLARAGDIPVPVHPAIHRSRSVSSPRPLFLRASFSMPESIAPWERGVIDLRRTSKRSRQAETPPDEGRSPVQDHHVVVPGDTLWDIAAKVLGTDDQRAIARYWPRIHKENLDIVGRNPDLIRPGQVLALPPKEQS